MREYAIQGTGGAPDWESIPALGIDNHMWLGQSDIRAETQICYGEDALFVRLRAWEAEIRAEHTGYPHQIADDSCLEFFFCPVPGDVRYFSVEMNPNAAMYLGFGSGRADLGRLRVSDEQVLFRPRPFWIDGGWGSNTVSLSSSSDASCPLSARKEGGGFGPTATSMATEPYGRTTSPGIR